MTLSSISPGLESVRGGEKKLGSQISHVVINSNNIALQRCFHAQQRRLPRGGDCGRRRDRILEQ